ncbi:hypothetical protein GCM10010172_10530 [Paractinoplanes ferrugineus]|uniref:Uncharacterized protein n=1 Tax=Paractinoplanes ferrugineus TaxID=113564 RepID=A0A919MIZ4_9ACTN|nr:hypothetical protein [Actinoplanes ferrugineus]GIE09617.1 hypothetical protein Afe05nite_14570 [Actinoplanes ferrugineus]
MFNLSRLSAAGVAAAAVALGVAAPASAGAGPPTQPPQQVTATAPRMTGCAGVESTLAWLAAHDVPNVQCAEQRTQPTPAAVVSLAARAPDGVPQWCVDHAFDGWWATRTSACSVSDWFLRDYDTASQQVTGTMDFIVSAVGDMSTTASQFGHRMALRSYSRSGTAVGTAVWAMNDCWADCDLADDSFPQQPMTDGADVGGWATFISMSDSPGKVGGFESSITFLLTNPNFFTPGIFSTVTLPRGRCDNATPGAAGPGCVFPDYVPAWFVGRAALPAYARFVDASQAAGLPGALTRLTDAALVAQNDAKVCVGCAGYPVNTSDQGPATGGGTARTFRGCLVKGVPTGVTGPSGYSLCRLPAAENSRAAAALDAFYIDNRVIKADTFTVRVR